METLGPVDWRTVGGSLQILGVIVISFGILRLREELEPQRSFLAIARRRVTSATIKLRFGARAVARWARRAAKNLWRRLRGRRPVSDVLGATSAVTVADGLSAQATGTAPSDWAKLTTVDEKLEDLHRRVRAGRDRTERLEKTVASHRADLDAAIGELRRHVRDLHLGGLTIEVLGAQLLVVGLVLGTWPTSVATSTALQAGFMSWAMLSVGLWATSDERRWWHSIP